MFSKTQKTVSLENFNKFKPFFTEYSDKELDQRKVGVASMGRYNYTILIGKPEN